jgi:hypothetical protein
MSPNGKTPNIPHESNYFAEVQIENPDAVAATFTHDGKWIIRKAGFEEFEVRSAYGELIIEAGGPVLVHGTLDPSAIEGVNRILASIGHPWKSEFYDDQGTILQSYGDVAT